MWLENKIFKECFVIYNMPRSLSQISYSLKGCKTDKEKKEYLRGIIKTSLPERYKTRAYENLGGIHRRLGEYENANF